MKTIKLITFTTLILGISTSDNYSIAADYSWAVRSGGDPVGLYSDGDTANFQWAWDPGGEAITGTAQVSRNNAGTYHITSESHNDSIDFAGAASPEYNNSPLAVEVGGVDGINHFFSDGELGRAVNDVPVGTVSTTVFQFAFDGNFAAPKNTLITFFDPGAFEGGISGPFTYDFDATINGQPVDIGSWSLTIEDPYLPAGNAPTGFSYEPTTGTLTLDSYFGGNFPQNLVFLDTGETIFDTLTLTADGLALDAIGIGFGAQTPPQVPEVPIPGALVLFLTGIFPLFRLMKKC